MSKGRLLNREEILKLKEGDKVWIEDLYDTFPSGVCEIEVKSNVIIANFITNGVMSYWTLEPRVTYGDLYRIKVYEYIEESKRYKGSEILKMIESGQLKDGDELIGYMPDGRQDGAMKVTDGGNGCLYIVSIDNLGKEELDSWDLINMTFSIKEKEYLTFDEARCVEKRIKHKDWDEFLELKDVVIRLGQHSNYGINKFLNEKVWEVEA